MWGVRATVRRTGFLACCHAPLRCSVSKVSPTERDGLFWLSSDAGLRDALKVATGFASLAVVFLQKVGCRSYLTITKHWHIAGGMHGSLARTASYLSLDSLPCRFLARQRAQGWTFRAQRPSYWVGSCTRTGLVSKSSLSPSKPE